MHFSSGAMIDFIVQIQSWVDVGDLGHGHQSKPTHLIRLTMTFFPLNSRI